MGVLSAVLGTLLGFIFAFAVVRCQIPGKRWVHLIAMVPTVSPPFAIALSTILLFGRNGLITKKLLGLDYNIYGMQGLVFVQVITFFTVAYLILRAMLERLNPAMEEAAESLGAGRFTSSARSSCRCSFPAWQVRRCCCSLSRWPTWATRPSSPAT